MNMRANNEHKGPPIPGLVWVDRASELLGRIGDVLIVLITVLLTYEVVARYVFSAPTKWTQDVSTLMQVWFTFLGMALVLRKREMIRITAILAIAPAWVRYLFEAIALIVILVFSVVAASKGYDMMQDSLRLGRRQPTMMAFPNWVGELPIVIGFALLALQSLVELIRLPFGPAPQFSVSGEQETPAAESDKSSQVSAS
ncbi:TRAP transporter small permease [Orrella marina]|uniref:TRAP transporter small permease protein n=2 Tax=Orrella marina TaxID=2163011 RepID=A0A2R4XID2_9BURK|nr:TRAP transporter small permease [Orrella marina]